MSVARLGLLMAIGLACSLGAAVGQAGTLVEISNLSEREPTKLLGYLPRPEDRLREAISIRWPLTSI